MGEEFIEDNHIDDHVDDEIINCFNEENKIFKSKKAK